MPSWDGKVRTVLFAANCKSFNKHFFLIQVLHILTKNVQSPDTISFGVPGTNQQESAQKPIRYRNVKLEYYSNYCKTESTFLLVDETYKNKRKK